MSFPSGFLWGGASVSTEEGDKAIRREGTVDFHALSYYHITCVSSENADSKAEEDGSIHDDYRIAYHREHIRAMEAVLDDGADLIGYTPWGCIGIVSMSTGEMAKRYGFVYADRQDDRSGDYARSRKDSFYWYQKVNHTNGADLG